MKISSDFTNDAGIPFVAVRIEIGEPYGTPVRHTQDGTLACRRLIAGAPLIEFYDTRWPNHWGCEFGQFVTRYYVESLALAKHLHTAAGGGLMLDGGIPSWRVSVANMRLVREQLYPESV